MSTIRRVLHIRNRDRWGADAFRRILGTRADVIPDVLLGLEKYELTDIADAADRLAKAARKVRDEGLTCPTCGGGPPRGFTCNTCEKPCADYTIEETDPDD